MEPAHDFDQEVRAAMAVPDPSPAFLAQLRGQLSMQAQTRRPLAVVFSRLAWAGLAASAVFLLLVVWVVGPSSVYASFRSLLAFVPGLGLVQNDASLRVLAEPVQEVQAGITVEVLDGAADSQHTVVLFQVDGIPQAARPTSEGDPGCPASVSLRSPDGSVLRQTGGGGNGWGTGYRIQAIFPALPVRSAEATLLIPCLMDTRPGSAPENWTIPLRFKPASADMKAFPVYDLGEPASTPAATVSSPEAGLPVEKAPELTNEATVNGTRIRLDQVIETGRGFILQGSISKDPKTMLVVRPGPGFQLLDAQGAVIPTEPYTDLGGGTLQDPTSSWGVETDSKAYPGPWKVSIPTVMIELTGMVPVDFDLGPAPAVGQTWELNQTLDFAGHALVVQSVQMTQGRDQTIWLDFTFGGSPEIFAISSSGDRDNRSLRPASKGSTAESGQITYALSYDAVPTGKHRIDIGGITVLQAGPWELGWQPPVTEASRTSPTAQPQACLTEEKWQALRSQPAQPLPAGLGGQFLLEQNTGLLMPQIFLADLRSGQQQPIAVGALSSLSPDGSRAAYIESNGQSILIAGTHGESPQPLLGSTAMDYGPIWSPDGSWIAFTRANDGVYILHPDGSGARRITSANLQASAAGWTPDSRALFISVTGAAGNQLQSIDLDTGAVQSWLTIENMKGGLGSVSPDGRQVLYSEKLFGRPYLGTWAANLDGSGKRLLAALDTAATRATAWSPDGKWVALGVSEQKRDTSLETLVLLQPDSCQVVLPGLSGSATGWR